MAAGVKIHFQEIHLCRSSVPSRQCWKNTFILAFDSKYWFSLPSACWKFYLLNWFWLTAFGFSLCLMTCFFKQLPGWYDFLSCLKLWFSGCHFSTLTLLVNRLSSYAILVTRLMLLYISWVLSCISLTIAIVCCRRLCLVTSAEIRFIFSSNWLFIHALI